MNSKIITLSVGLMAAGVACAALKDAYRDKFVVGAALSADVFTGEVAAEAAAVAAEFSTITAENEMKPERVQPPHICIMEGDTPSFLGLIRNGLGWSESPDYGGWGGRYVWRTFKDEPHPIWTSPEQCEEYYGTWRNGNSIVRWREDYQLDFAARIRWSVTPRYEDANHNPTAVINGRPGRAVIHLEAMPGATLALDASGSSDPDGDRLSYSWQIYRAASSLKGGTLKADGAKATVDLSDVAADGCGDLHVILRVRDSGTPSLAVYRRVIIHVH